MIIQGLIDFFCQVLAGFLQLFPPLPPQFSQSIGAITGIGAQVGSTIAKLGPVIPFDILNTFSAAYIAVLAAWGASMLIRLVLWAVGR